jgi:hypothetical protein
MFRRAALHPAAPRRVHRAVHQAAVEGVEPRASLIYAELILNAYHRFFVVPCGKTVRRDALEIALRMEVVLLECVVLRWVMKNFAR